VLNQTDNQGSARRIQVSGGRRADLIELEAIRNRLDSIGSAYAIKIYQ
jgi:hypothetical protein